MDPMYINHMLLTKKDKKSKTLFIIGCITFPLGLMYALMALTGNIETTEDSMNPLGAALMMIFVCWGTGLVLLLISKKIKKESNLYKTYINIVTSQDNLSIDNIANCVGVKREAALIDLYRMLQLGYFHGSRIDEFGNKFLIWGNTVQMKNNKCNNCGAINNEQAVKAGKCEFCNSSLEIKTYS